MPICSFCILNKYNKPPHRQRKKRLPFQPGISVDEKGFFSEENAGSAGRRAGSPDAIPGTPAGERPFSGGKRVFGANFLYLRPERF